MWIAERRGIHTTSDEGTAAAYDCYGRFESRDAARSALIEGVKREIDAWMRMGMSEPAKRDGQILAILTTTDLDVADAGNVRFQVREF